MLLCLFSFDLSLEVYRVSTWVYFLFGCVYALYTLFLYVFRCNLYPLALFLGRILCYDIYMKVYFLCVNVKSHCTYAIYDFFFFFHWNISSSIVYTLFQITLCSDIWAMKIHSLYHESHKLIIYVQLCKLSN